MIKSMTGFAHREIRGELLSGRLLLKSYNNRYLDLSLSLPPSLAKLEPRFRDYLSTRIIHGKVECALRIRELKLPVIVSADMEAARSVASVLSSMAKACDLDDRVRLSDLLGFDGVVAYQKDVDEEKLWEAIGTELAACYESYDETRRREGESTLEDIQGQLARVNASFAAVRMNVPEIERSIKTQLSARFREVMGETADQNRILAETATLLLKYTINEEVTRLQAHLASFVRILATENSPGKKLDFLCQEINREVNTIGSKNTLIEVAQAVVEMKDALENIREQLRNIE
jgi:uncharacterized protein (TIGR00255 family)